MIWIMGTGMIFPYSDVGKAAARASFSRMSDVFPGDPNNFMGQVYSMSLLLYDAYDTIHGYHTHMARLLWCVQRLVDNDKTNSFETTSSSSFPFVPFFFLRSLCELIEGHVIAGH